MPRERVRVEYRFIIPLGNRLYQVQSKSRPDVVWHYADLAEGTCTCEDSIANKNPECNILKYLRSLHAQCRLPDQPNEQITAS